MSWMGTRLEEVAARMRDGHFGTPQIEFSDSEKIDIAQRLQKQYGCTVWIDEGRLRYRHGSQGPRLPLCWRDAAVLVEMLPARKEPVTSKGGRPRIRQVRFYKSA